MTDIEQRSHQWHQGCWMTTMMQRQYLSVELNQSVEYRLAHPNCVGHEQFATLRVWEA
jgi:hypothetical protein